MQKTLKTRLLILFLTVVMLVGVMTPAHAYELVYIQTSIDPSTWEIVSSVLRTNVGVSKHSPEVRRIPDEDLSVLAVPGNSVDEFNAMFLKLQDDEEEERLKDDLEIANGTAEMGLLTNIGMFNEENRALSFPTNQIRRKDSTPEDYEAALEINNKLVSGLNQAFSAYLENNGIKKTNDAKAYMDKMLDFLSSCDITDDECTYEQNDKEFHVKWKMQKPDGKWISWGVIAYEAFYNYCLEGEEAVNAGNVYADMADTSAFTKIIVWFFAKALDSLRSALGLWGMDELVFSQGFRSQTYLGGIFPAAWENILWTLFSIFEIFGAAMLLAGVIISVVHKALSTTNIIERMHLMEKIQDLIVCAIILAILPFVLRILMSLSSSLTQITYDMLPTDTGGKTKEIDDLVKRFTSSNGTIGGVVGQFMYFGIQIYFNFYYAIRAFTVPVLIVMSPLFVCGICLSSSKKQSAIQWSKELISFIFMQPIHAFCISFLLNLPASGRAFDNVIMLYAIIPLSQTIKTLCFGQTSGFAERSAEKAKGTATGLMAAASIGAVTAGVKGAAPLIGGGGAGRGSGDGGSNGSNDRGSDGSSDSGAPICHELSVSPPDPDAIKKILEKAKNAPSQAKHFVTNSRLGQAVSNNKGFFGTLGTKGFNGKDLAVGAVKTGIIKPAKGVFKTSKVGAKVAGGMALGAAGGVIGAMGGRDLGRMMSEGGGAVIAGRKLNKNDSAPEQNSQSDPTTNPNPTDPNAEDFVAPISLNTGGTRDADDVVNGMVMEPRSFNQNDLNQMGISNVSYERGNLRFSSMGDSPQAQELRAYAQYLDTLTPEQKQEEIERRGISATQDGDATRVRIDSKTWSKANAGATIDGYTNKKGDSSISISTPKNGPPPSFTGGQIMNVDPTQIPGYQKKTSIGKCEDGITRKTTVGSIPTQNMTDVQRAIISSGEGVTHDSDHFYVPLDQNGQPQKYTQKISFAAREKHINQSNEINSRSQPQPQPISGPDSDKSQTPTQNGSVQTEPSKSPTERVESEPVEIRSEPAEGVKPGEAETKTTRTEDFEPKLEEVTDTGDAPIRAIDPEKVELVPQSPPEPSQPLVDDLIPYTSFTPVQSDSFSFEEEASKIDQDALDFALTEELNSLDI